jgi:hypothetical protein
MPCTMKFNQEEGIMVTGRLKKVTIAGVITFLFLFAAMLKDSSADLIFTYDDPETLIAWEGYNPHPNDWPKDLGGDYDLYQLLYKAEFGGGEFGYYKDSYVTDPLTVRYAELYWEGPDVILYENLALLVKDGSAWGFIWDLSGWDGKEKIIIDLEKIMGADGEITAGSISHVAIWGYGPVQVPEPSTFLLLGVGLAGLAFCARRRMKS